MSCMTGVIEQLVSKDVKLSVEGIFGSHVVSIINRDAKDQRADVTMNTRFHYSKGLSKARRSFWMMVGCTVRYWINSRV